MGDAGEARLRVRGRGKGERGGFVMRMEAILAFDVLLGKRVVLTEESSLQYVGRRGGELND